MVLLASMVQPLLEGMFGSLVFMGHLISGALGGYSTFIVICCTVVNPPFSCTMHDNVELFCSFLAVKVIVEKWVFVPFLCVLT